MIKLLLIACAFASSIFMCTQLVTLYYFNHNYPSTNHVNQIVKSHRLLESVIDVQKICQKLNIDLILVDDDYLKDFLLTEISHRESGNHIHDSCQIFCKKSLVSFMIVEPKFDEKLDDFIESLQNKGFLTNYEEDYDKPRESLEHRHSSNKLIYHILLEKEDILIHFVVSHPFHKGYMWTHKCNPHKVQQEKWIPHLSSQTFCRTSQIFKPIEKTKALIDGIYIYIPQYLRTYLNEFQDSEFKFCNYNQARTFYSRNGYDSSPSGELFRVNADDLLRTATEVLSKLGVRFWLSSGTCLGWFRQCDFIPHSKDVDIGIWITDYNDRLIDKFEKHGLKLIHMFGKVEDSFELSFSMGNLKLDIFFFYKEKDYMWNGGTQARTGKKYKYRFNNFSLCWTYFRGLFVRVPCETKKYILANYGGNWGMLVKEWDWKRSPPNVKENGEWPIEERANVIKLFKSV